MTKNLLTIITIVLLFSSCSTRYDNPHNYFIPHEGNGLKLTQKDDLVASGSVGVNSFSYNYYNQTTFDFANFTVEQLSSNFQVAYSPIKHLGVFGSHSRLRMRDENNASNVFHKSHLTSVGVGTYYGAKFLQRPLDKILPGRKEKFDEVVLDLYGGYSIGKLENNFFTAVGNDEFNIHKLYFQIGLHWEVGNFGLSYMHKRGLGTYPSGTVNGEASFEQFFKIQTILEDNQVNFTENAFQIDYKREYLGLYAQLMNSKVNQFGFAGNFDSIINFGVTVDIHSFAKTALFKQRKKLED